MRLQSMVADGETNSEVWASQLKVMQEQLLNTQKKNAEELAETQELWAKERRQFLAEAQKQRCAGSLRDHCLKKSLLTLRLHLLALASPSVVTLVVSSLPLELLLCIVCLVAGRKWKRRCAHMTNGSSSNRKTLLKAR